MLSHLESNAKSLGINGFGISLSTLEEVFMKVGHGGGVRRTDLQILTNSTKNQTTARGEANEESTILLRGVRLCINQIVAMLFKRFACTVRAWKSIIAQNVLPILIIVLTLISLSKTEQKKEQINLKITLDSYKSPVTVVTHGKRNRYSESYIRIVDESNGKLLDWKAGDMNILMEKETEEHTSKVRNDYIIGAAFDEKDKMIAFFNNIPLHSPPLALQMALNAILQTEVSSSHYLQFYNFPVPRSMTALSYASIVAESSEKGFKLSQYLGFAMTFTSAFYIMFYIRERVCSAKHLQFVSGVGVLTFWLSTLLVDYIFFGFTVILILLTFTILQEDGYREPENLVSRLNYYKIESPGIGKNIKVGFIEGAVCILVLCAVDYQLLPRIRSLLSRRLPPSTNEDNDDYDVAQEKALVRNLSKDEIQNYKIVMRDVTKYYRRFLAVNRICLAIKGHECFGLLGVNGAGKTTTFKMMTGEKYFSYGKAWTCGLNIRSQMNKIHQIIGYCPQFDGLLDELTVKESLIIYGLIRGVTVTKGVQEAKRLAQDLDFYQHFNKQVKDLSGGNKRKVSTAVALMGNPQIIYLDEPTTGMDPATKRFLWNVLCQERDCGKCIVLSSHSMEECEALCTRLAIMVNGRFLCLGSTQHLKSKFSDGFTLTIKIKKPVAGQMSDSDLKAIHRFVHDNFRDALLTEQHQQLVTYRIPKASQTWSKMFGILEKGKRSYNIEDYSIGQSTLEQVFLEFTKYQKKNK